MFDSGDKSSNGGNGDQSSRRASATDWPGLKHLDREPAFCLLVKSFYCICTCPKRVCVRVLACVCTCPKTYVPLHTLHLAQDVRNAHIRTLPAPSGYDSTWTIRLTVMGIRSPIARRHFAEAIPVADH